MTKKQRILIVEDDQVVATVYRNKLTLEGFDVKVAGDGETGLNLFRSFAPHALLMDLMLPKLPGIEIIKRIRSEAAFDRLPIVVFSNTYLSSVMQEAWKAGATKCLAKASCTPSQVIGTLNELLQVQSPATPTTASPSTPAAATTSSDSERSDSDSGFQDDLRVAFIRHWPATLKSIRSLLQNLVKANAEARTQHLEELYRKVHFVTGGAALGGFAEIAQLADVLEALLRELHLHPKNLNTSTLRTVASAIDLLGQSFDSKGVAAASTPAKVLVVDDEVISRRAVTHALSKAHLKTVCVEDPTRAIEVLAQSPFDLIILDVDMPEMNGYELCSRLRSLPAYRNTPVVFVTSLNDLEARANSTMSGGNDFIAKPFLFIELAVKALVFIWRARLQTTIQPSQPRA